MLKDDPVSSLIQVILIKEDMKLVGFITTEKLIVFKAQVRNHWV